MFDYNKIDDLVKKIKIDANFKADRFKLWHELLGTSISSPPREIIEKAIKGSVGQFNYWEENGQIIWPEGVNSDSWFTFLKRSITKDPLVRINLALDCKLNLVSKRLELLANAEKFIEESKDIEQDIHDTYWWRALSAVFGGDPLRKRETLLWIILNDLGFTKIPLQEWGCIDYNIILLFRFLGLVSGYKGNIFTLYDETKLRYDCLRTVEYMLDENEQLTISSLDSWLWAEGRRIRKTYNRSMWDPYFCYRLGCFFY